MYILPHSAKYDYRLSQEDTEAMVRNSGHVKYYATWYSQKLKNKQNGSHYKSCTARLLCLTKYVCQVLARKYILW